MYDTISMCLYPCSERKGLLKISRVRLPNNERGNNNRKKFDLHQGGKGCVIWLFIKIETEAFNASGQVPAATIEQAIPFQSHLCWVSQEFFKSQFESAQPNEDLRKLTEERLTRPFTIRTRKKIEFQNAFPLQTQIPFVFEASLEFIPNYSMIKLSHS